MSGINLGSQDITFRFKEYAQGKEFDKFLRAILKSGIYEGGTLYKIDNSTIGILPFTAWFNIDADKACHIATTTNISLTVLEATPVLYMTYTWVDSVDNYIDFAWKAVGAAAVTNEIIVGKVNFTGSIVDGTFDYTLRTPGLIDATNNIYVTNLLKFDNVSNVSISKYTTNTLATPNNLNIGGNLAVTGSLSVASSGLIVSNLSAGNFDTDPTLAANSDSKIATQKAVKTYVSGVVTNAPVFRTISGPTWIYTNTSLTPPANATTIIALLFGGGGGAGSGCAMYGGGGGGASGGYTMALIPIIPGMTYTAIVGTGGAGAPANYVTDGYPGGDTYIHPYRDNVGVGGAGGQTPGDNGSGGSNGRIYGGGGWRGGASGGNGTGPNGDGTCGAGGGGSGFYGGAGGTYSAGTAGTYGYEGGNYGAGDETPGDPGGLGAGGGGTGGRGGGHSMHTQPGGAGGDGFIILWYAH